jgi:C_GCAxxG_C_C family probable redox protein
MYIFFDDLRIETNSALKLACGSGAGMGRKEEVCGVVTGEIIAIACKYGRGEKDDPTATGLTYTKTRELMDQFAKRHDTFSCRKLLNGCELTTEEGKNHFKQNNLRSTICVPCVQSVVDILEDIL